MNTGRFKNRLAQRAGAHGLERVEIRAVCDANYKDITFERERFNRAHSIPGVAVALQDLLKQVRPHFAKVFKPGLAIVVGLFAFIRRRTGACSWRLLGSYGRYLRLRHRLRSGFGLRSGRRRLSIGCPELLR